jgi:tetratricopeptide (TPR) repeat protein
LEAAVADERAAKPNRRVAKRQSFEAWRGKNIIMVYQLLFWPYMDFPARFGTCLWKGGQLGSLGAMLPRAWIRLLIVVALSATPPLAAQEETPSAAGDDTYAQIPVWGEAGEKKLESGDTAGAIAEFKKAFEASRELKRQYPDEPAYTENAYYYLQRLASAFSAAGDIPHALQMAEPSARGYAELLAANPSPDNTLKATQGFVQLAWYQVLTKDGTGAEASARYALQVTPSDPAATVNLAHALLLNGKPGEAEALYRRVSGSNASDGRSFRDIILEDFDAMEKAGVGNPGLAEMRAKVGEGKALADAVFARSSGVDTGFWLFFGLVLLAIAAIAGLIIYFDRKRTAKLEAATKALGFTFRRKATPDDKKLTSGSQLWTVGRRRHIRNIIEVPEVDGARMTLFEFSYETGGGKHSRTHTQTVARFNSPKLSLPAFDLRPEGLMSKLVQTLGYKDIDIEGAPTFSKMFQLRGQDDAAIRRLFTAPIVQYCERDKWLWMSGAGNLLWFHRERYRAKPEELQAYVTRAREAFALFAGNASASAQVPPPLPSA